MNFLASFVQFLVLIPAALLCYLPMKTKLRYSPARTAGLFGLVYLFFIPAAAWILTFFHIGANASHVSGYCYILSVLLENVERVSFQGTCCLYPQLLPVVLLLPLFYCL